MNNYRSSYGVNNNIIVAYRSPIIAKGIINLINCDDFRVYGVQYGDFMNVESNLSQLKPQLFIYICNGNSQSKSLELKKIKFKFEKVKFFAITSSKKVYNQKEIIFSGWEVVMGPETDESYLEEKISELCIGATRRAIKEPKTILSKREFEVASLVVKGLSSQQIANDLFLSPHTVKTHRKNIKKKLGINSPYELIKIIENK